MIHSFIELVNALKSAPIVGNAESYCRTMELVNVNVALNPGARIFRIPGFQHGDPGYFAAQLAWYLRGVKGVLDGINYYDDSWGRIQPLNSRPLDEPGDKNFDINSNYGVYIWQEGQIDKVIHRLFADQDSRRALILLNRPEINKSSTRDHVCTTSLQFLIRQKQLIMITTMRSNDLVMGFCNDVPFFMFLQEMVFARLQKCYTTLQLGSYYHNVGSMHVYEKDWRIFKISNASFTEEAVPSFGPGEAEFIKTRWGADERAMRLFKAVPAHVTGYNCYNWLVDVLAKRLGLK